MKEPYSIRRVFWSVLFVVLALILFLAPKAAVNIDEIIHYRYAHQVIDWFASKGEDDRCLHTPVTNLKYYGQSVDNFTALINRTFSIENEYLTRHYTGAFLAWLLLVVTGLLAVKITGSYTVGLVAVLLYAISPRPMGQAFGNLKDIPFSLGYTAGILALVRIFKRMPAPRWKDILLFALAIAFTNSVRIGGLVLYFYAVLFLVWWLLLHRNEAAGVFASPEFWKIGVVVLVIGYFGGLLFWPYGLNSPLVHPLESLRVMEHYKVSIRQIFMGEVFWSTDLPWYYLPVWLFISIPEVVWLGVAGYIAMLFWNNKGQVLPMGILQFSLLFPVLYVIIKDANLYSGWRQMYFIYSPLVIISSVGIVNGYRKLKGNMARVCAFIVVLSLSIFPLLHSIKSFPADYIYFNKFAGGSKEAWSNYEYDYYWHGMKEAFEWVEKNEPLSDGTIIASNFNVGVYSQKSNKLRYKYVHYYERNSTSWDFAILGINYVHPAQMKNGKWKPENCIKVFYHKNNPVIIVLKNQDSRAIEGSKKYANREIAEAAKLLEEATEVDSLDVRLLSMLGGCYLNKNEWMLLDSLLKKGFEIHPYYEPFFVLKARMEYEKGDYKSSKETCLQALSINPRYREAITLLTDCYKKLGEHNPSGKKYRVN